jgi:hypothetical protein
MHRKLAANNAPGSKTRPQTYTTFKALEGEREFLRLLCLLKSGYASVEGLLGRLSGDAKSDCVIGVDGSEALSISPATQIE